MATPSKKIDATTSPQALPGKSRIRPVAKRDLDLVVLTNAEGIITYADPALLPLLSHMPEALVGSPIGSLLHPEDAGALRRLLGELAATPGKSLKAICRLRARDGAVHLAEGSATNLLQVPGVGAIVIQFHQPPPRQLAPRAPRRKTRATEHFVQFYENDEFLLNALASFIETGLNAGEGCIVIATPTHRAALESQLRARGLDLTAAQMQGTYLSLDAAETLKQFTVAGTPEQERFNALVVPIIAQAAQNGRRVRVFGEMVALLWAAGNQAAVIHLEELWNHLPRATPPFSLFCAYAMSSFAGEENEAPFLAICQQHARVIPAESYPALSRPDERLRAISVLQQKANSLQAEIAERKAAEQRAFEALTALLSLARSLAWTQQNAEPQTIRTFAPQLAELARQTLGCERVTLTLCHPETTALETLAIAGTPANGSRQWPALAQGARLEEALPSDALTALQAGVSFVVEMPPEAFRASSLESSRRLVAPMRVAERLVGFVTYDSGPGTQSYTSQERHLAEAVAQLAAFVLEREHWLAERTETQAQLLALEETARQMEAFVSIVSHELRTPVTALKTSVQLARRRIDKELAASGQKAEEQRSPSTATLLERTETQVRRLTRLIDDLVDLSRIRSGKLELRVERCDLGQIVTEVVESERLVHPNRAIRFKLPRSPLPVQGDPDRLGQVILNYLTNALKYSPPDRPISVQIQPRSAQVRVSVQDQGPGISAEEQQRIWQPFHRVPEVQVQSGSGIGLGLGLHISKTMIERQGGHVGLESAVGQGSTFWFSLPLASQQPPENPKEPFKL